MKRHLKQPQAEINHAEAAILLLTLAIVVANLIRIII